MVVASLRGSWLLPLAPTWEAASVGLTHDRAGLDPCCDWCASDLILPYSPPAVSFGYFALSTISSFTHHLADFVLYFLMLLGQKHSPLIRIFGDNTLCPPPNLPLFYHLMSDSLDMPFFLSTLILQSLHSLLIAFIHGLASHRRFCVIFFVVSLWIWVRGQGSYALSHWFMRALG